MSRRAAEHRETARAWDVVARAKYRDELDEHVARLKAGAHNLLPEEAEILESLLPGADVVHLQCSHGLDTLGLLNAGARSVVGVDISGEMIAQARAKAEAVGAAEASFVCADATSPPPALSETADLVYTGRGSLPWILDLGSWADAVRGVLRPGGRLFLFEAHPLTRLWDRDASEPELRAEVGYFDTVPSEDPGFPASVVERELGGARPRMVERHWRPGEVIESLLGRGFHLELFREFPTLYWNQFPNWPDEVRRRLPNSYAVLARLG